LQATPDKHPQTINVPSHTFNLAASLLNHIKKQEKVREAKKREQPKRNYEHRAAHKSKDSSIVSMKSCSNAESVSNSEQKLKQRLGKMEERSRYKSAESRYLNQ